MLSVGGGEGEEVGVLGGGSAVRVGVVQDRLAGEDRPTRPPCRRPAWPGQ